MRAKHTGWEGSFQCRLEIRQCTSFRDTMSKFCVFWFCFELCVLFWVLRFCFGVLRFYFVFCDSVLSFAILFLMFVILFCSSLLLIIKEELVRNCPKGLEWNRNCKNQRNLRSVLKPSCTNSNQILVFRIKLICLIFLEHLSLIKGQEFCSWRSKWLGVQYKLCEAPNDITQLAAYD